MTDTLAVALAQLNATVGDVDGNVARLLAGRACGADVSYIRRFWYPTRVVWCGRHFASG